MSSDYLGGMISCLWSTLLAPKPEELQDNSNDPETDYEYHVVFIVLTLIVWLASELCQKPFFKENATTLLPSIATIAYGSKYYVWVREMLRLSVAQNRIGLITVSFLAIVCWALRLRRSHLDANPTYDGINVPTLQAPLLATTPALTQETPEPASTGTLPERTPPQSASSGADADVCTGADIDAGTIRAHGRAASTRAGTVHASAATSEATQRTGQKRRRSEEVLMKSLDGGVPDVKMSENEELVIVVSSDDEELPDEQSRSRNKRRPVLIPRREVEQQRAQRLLSFASSARR